MVSSKNIFKKSKNSNILESLVSFTRKLSTIHGYPCLIVRGKNGLEFLVFALSLSMTKLNAVLIFFEDLNPKKGNYLKTYKKNLFWFET